MTFMGIDLGTSGLRVLLVDENGAPLGSTERHYDVAHPHPGWSEQDPQDWISALEDAVAELRDKVPAWQASAIKMVFSAGERASRSAISSSRIRAAAS